MKRQICILTADRNKIVYTVSGEYNGKDGYSEMTLDRFLNCLVTGRFENGDLKLFKELINSKSTHRLK